MDNFVIPEKTMEKLEERMIRFLKIAEKYNLCFKRSKCNFNIEEIPILGVIVGKGQVKMKQEKIKAVKKWKTPTKVKDIKSFLSRSQEVDLVFFIFFIFFLIFLSYFHFPS